MVQPRFSPHPNPDPKLSERKNKTIPHPNPDPKLSERKNKTSPHTNPDPKLSERKNKTSLHTNPDLISDTNDEAWIVKKYHSNI